MAAHTKIKIFYISLGFWLIIGVESYSSRSNKVLTVQTGGSVTIPCHYDKKYTQQKKYWYSENDNTYKNTSEENLSIIDHPDQSFFTVTMRNLQNKHTGHYFCVVETGEQPSTKIIYEPYLKIQSAPDVSVVSSSVSGHEGGNISVQCFYSSDYQNKLKQWCRYKDQSCYTVGRTDTSQNPSVQISSDDGRRSFTVLMTGLRLTDSGWYYCSAGEALNPVHLTVTEAEPDKEKDTSATGKHDIARIKIIQMKSLTNHKSITSVLFKIYKAYTNSMIIRLKYFRYFLFSGAIHAAELVPHHFKKLFEKIFKCFFISHRDHELLTVWLLVSAALLLLLILICVFIWRWRRRPNKNQISRTTDTDPINPYYSIIDDVPRSEVMKSPAGGAIYSIIYSTVGPH
uniref:Ig-like domain-containing protein n=1 Tax=Cyprinus carpio carpio TaxID=630221 RepID=A0A8C0YD73_CYPCA